MAEVNESVSSIYHSEEYTRSPAFPRTRRVLTWVLCVLFCLSLLGSTVAIWAELYPLNTERWVVTTAPVARDPAVRNALDSYATQMIMQQLQLEQRLANLPPVLVAPLVASAHNYVQSELANFLQSDTFQHLWKQLNRQAHAQTLAALRGQHESAAVAHAAFKVNLLPAIFAGMQALQRNLPAPFSSLVQLPTLPNNASPTRQRQALSQALGTPLPASFGQLTLYQGSQIVVASHVVRVLDVLVRVLPPVTLVLLLLTLLLAVNRRRSLIGLGLGTALVIVPLVLLLPYTVTALQAGLPQGLTRSLASDLLAREFQSLRVVSLCVLAAGLLVALIAFLCGRRARTHPGCARS